MFGQIPYFTRLSVENLVNHFNTLINEINGNFQAVGFGYNGSVTRRQFLSALANQGVMGQVISGNPGIPANPNSLVYIQYISGLTVTPNDPLAQNVKQTLGYTDQQMANLFAAAELLTP